MNISKTANDITNLYGLKENQNLSNEERFEKIKEIIEEIYYKGYNSVKTVVKSQFIKILEETEIK